jgi:hypothetical protein
MKIKYAPVDGKVVVIEEYTKGEYFKEKTFADIHFHVTY